MRFPKITFCAVMAFSALLLFVPSAGFATAEEYGVFPDYKIQGVESEKLSTGLAGFAGTLLVFGFAFLMTGTRPRPRQRAA